MGFDKDSQAGESPPAVQYQSWHLPFSHAFIGGFPKKSPEAVVEYRLVWPIRSLREVEVVAVQLVELRVLQREGVAPRSDDDVVA